MKNKESTRFYSDLHEQSVCNALNGRQTSNSGANKFEKGDVIIDNLFLIECKGSMSDKKSVSIKEDWIKKNKEESFRNRIFNSVLCFNFKPCGENYYVIEEKLMKFLIEKIKEEGF